MLDYAPPVPPVVTNNRRLASTAHSHLKRYQDLFDTVLNGVARFTPTLLRVALGVVYIWFGALKIFGYSPVEQLLAATLPWFDPAITVPVLGGVEIVLGTALLIGRAPRLVLLACAGHLVGTFLTFVTAPDLMISHSNLTLLTGDGEFVIKNFVLIGAALLLASHHSGQTRTSRPASAVN